MQGNTTIKERLAIFLAHLGIGQAKFGKSCGLSTTFASNVGKAIGSEKLKQITDVYPMLNATWLLFGTGEMLINQYDLSDTKYNKPQVPYYNVDFIGGFDVIVNNQTTVPDGYIALPKFGKIDCWVDISGKSMEPLISSGDIIALRQVNDWRNNILYGEVYAIVTAEYRTVKRLRKGSSSDTIKLVPDNPNYDEQEIPILSIHSVYQVMGCTKKMF